MKYLLTFWALPLVVFWGWYFLSLNDLNFGYVMLTSEANQLVFQLYGDTLGIDPASIPPLVARACVFDSFLLAAIVAFRRRAALLAWARAQRARYLGADASPMA